MKKYRNILLNALLTMVASALITGSVFAQKPEITAIDKVKGPMEEVVTLKGSNFGIVKTDLVVFFGAQRAEIKSVSDQLLEVAVPPGATYDNISVTNLANKLTGYSTHQFLLSFSGTTPFDASKLGAQQDFNADSELYDHCLCDFDVDGRVDIATANRSSSNISILQNTSTGVGNINFTTLQKAVGFGTLQIKCSDLNSDGLPDIVATEGTKLATDTRVFLLQNTGGMNFSIQSILLTEATTAKIDIADLDRDGKPEVVFTDQTNDQIHILKNQSNGALVMDAPISITIPGAVNSDGISLEDLNGDDLPEIITSQFGSSPSDLFIAKNNSTPGSLSFAAFVKLDLENVVRDVRIGDIDGDRKPDIICSQFLSGRVAIFLNTSSSSTISFSLKPSITALVGIWGLDLGDLDGDGDIDIVGSSNTQTKISIATNQSTPGTVSFGTVEKNVTFITRHVRVGDLDGDGKPDISFTSVDKVGIPASKISVFRNQSCVTPKLTPSTTPVALCAGVLPYKLTATASNGSFYEWLKNGAVVACGKNMYAFDITAATGSGTYSVKIHGEGSTSCATGNCAIESNTIDVTIGAATSGLVIPKSSPATKCAGANVTLDVTNDVVGNTYVWTAPNGTQTSGKVLSLPDFQLDDAGIYEVAVTRGGCVISKETIRVEVYNIPNFAIGYPGSANLCVGDPAKQLSVLPVVAGFSFQWTKDGNNIASATTDKFNVTSVNTSSGSYTVKISNASCPAVTIPLPPPAVITVVPTAVATITAPTDACKGQEISFTAGANVGDVDYQWTFGDTQSSTEKDPKHSYATANSFTVNLTVSYDGACAVTATPHSITISDAPTMTVTTTAADYKICEGETITLSIANTFVDPVWSNGDTGFSTTVSAGGTYSVTAKASPTNECLITAQSNPVIKIPGANIVLSAEPPKINEGESSQLNADGLLSYTWSPADGLSATNIPNPVAQPLATITYSVSGPDENGCTSTATITLTVIGEAIVNKLGPKNFFSPNNSGPNDTWLVENIIDFPQCAVTIYDDKGVKVFDAKPYANDWNGMFNGKELPDGVYFYVIRCEGEENSPRTGSITLIR